MICSSGCLRLASASTWSGTPRIGLSVAPSICSAAPSAVASRTRAVARSSASPGAIDLTLVAHIFDVAHDLGIDPPEDDDGEHVEPVGDLAIVADNFERVPVLVLPCLVRYRDPTPFEGASIMISPMTRRSASAERAPYALP